VKIWHKVLQTTNKTCTKHLFLLTNFARRPSLTFRMHVALSVPIQIEMFGGQFFSGTFCNSRKQLFQYNLSSTE